jgi:copper homeostasis protein CutC
LGCDRLLTSGQGASALDGSDFLRQLIQQNPEMEIVPGGGITENNLVLKNFDLF